MADENFSVAEFYKKLASRPKERKPAAQRKPSTFKGRDEVFEVYSPKKKTISRP